jgi:hypothetical protein
VRQAINTAEYGSVKGPDAATVRQAISIAEYGPSAPVTGPDLTKVRWAINVAEYGNGSGPTAPIKVGTPAGAGGHRNLQR